MLAYLDTSAIVCIILEQPGWERFQQAFVDAEELLSCPLMEAELFATVRREDVALTTLAPLVGSVSIIHPDRSLSSEYRSILELGYVRGADLFHLAHAVWVAGDRRDSLHFITGDERQGVVAKALGFPLLEER